MLVFAGRVGLTSSASSVPVLKVAPQINVPRFLARCYFGLAGGFQDPVVSHQQSRQPWAGRCWQSKVCLESSLSLLVCLSCVEETPRDAEL